ncbi:MAG: GAF domain-containing protein [Deltaproteobacteria bacterium]|nr:GAF domain-containing protein [Deltaproteobacteria bacterium]
MKSARVDGFNSDFITDLRKVLCEDSSLSNASVERVACGIQVAVGDCRIAILDSHRLSDKEELSEELTQEQMGLLIIGPFPNDAFLDFIRAKDYRWLEDGSDKNALYLAIKTLHEQLLLRRDKAAADALIGRYRYELDEMIAIARAITQERDLDKLLGLILEKSRFITGADAGSIYVVETDDQDEQKHRLRFKLSQNDSVDFHSKEFVMPVSNRSIVGSAVLLREPINIPDVYDLDSSVSYEFDSSFDSRSGYRSRSMLTVPLISAQDDVIGVIQLINKKGNPEQKLKSEKDVHDGVVSFDKRSEELLATFAAQAGIALENALLYDEIQRIFEGFVRASVQAIEQRDPSTSGHSMRVSILACALAREVDKATTGFYKDTRINARDMRELNYACLLHDFGKIGVREQVLLKATKLYPHQLENIRLRIDLAIKSAETEFLRRKTDLLQKRVDEKKISALENALIERKKSLEKAWEFIRRADEPTLVKGASASLSELREITYVDGRERQHALLTEEEIAALAISRGSLNHSEVNEIRSHVVHTYNFLSKIPWGKSMARIPKIASAHHERLDGSGYPNGISSDQIPLLSKIMAIVDIYDALTAADRTYKKALPREKALGIIESEAQAGYLDLDLVKIFIEKGVYTVESD